MIAEEYLSDWKVILFTGIFVCFCILYRYMTNNNDYFSKKNVAYIKPSFPFGSMGPVFMKRQSFLNYTRYMYKELEGSTIGGLFQFREPVYVVRDPELIKLVTIKDFDHFVDIPIIIPEDSEPILAKNLQSLKGQRWKDMRSILSPAFTSSKMKTMFVLISETGKQLVSYLENELENQQSANNQESRSDPVDVLPLDMKDLLSRFTNDVIATCAFGVQCNSLQDPNNDFYKMGKEFVKFSFKKFIVFIVYTLLPKTMKALGFRLVPKEIANFFRSLVSESIQMREREGIVRPDMIHLLMQVRDDDMFEDKPSSDLKVPDAQDPAKSKKMSLDIDDIAAQALVFFSAGFEVVSILMSFSTLMLATHPDIQEALRQEVDDSVSQHDGEVTYEAVQNMKLLDGVVSETLRLYPPAPMFSRKCVKDYHVPGMNLVLEKDISIVVPVGGLHYDPKFFPDPEAFNPTRFMDENKHNIHPCTYLPFGIGPRQCIANRFALMETKAALVHIVRNFELKVCSKTKIPIQVAKDVQLKVEGGFWVGLKLREDRTSSK